MNGIQWFARPWWVNLLLLVPLFLFWFYRLNKLEITRMRLLVSGIFGIAFGFIEAAVVVYLRAALGFLPGFKGTLGDVIRHSRGAYQQVWAANDLPKSLMTVESLREIATMLVLLSVAYLSARKLRERTAIFLWTFAFWDLFYYAGLWFTVRWPDSLKAKDVLFLLPTPWTAQVWFPFLVSGLTALAIAINRRKP